MTHAVESYLVELNRTAPPFGAITHGGSVAFGRMLMVERFRLANGLQLLHVHDDTAPVVAYHTWFQVGSRHEQEGKTGLAHLFEHLMFNETESLAAGEFDRKLEEAGADSNAATWLDWTHYHVAVPSDQLQLVIDLESERMHKLVLREPQVESEKEVVANERRYRVDDEVESSVSEHLWAMALTQHSYGHPTIGWMKDIEGFTTADCEAFYRTYYAPNNATLVVVGDIPAAELLPRIQAAYGHLPPSEMPIEDPRPEPPQVEERRAELEKPTTSEKVALAYPCPALGDVDHAPLSVLSEILFGGRASRVKRRMIRELEVATEARMFVGPFRDQSLVELWLSARGDVRAERLLELVDEELERVRLEPVSRAELERALARMELSTLAGLDTADGKASTIGFYETVLGSPGHIFDRLEMLSRVTAGDILRVARRYLRDSARSVILVRASAGASEGS